MEGNQEIVKESISFNLENKIHTKIPDTEKSEAQFTCDSTITDHGNPDCPASNSSEPLNKTVRAKVKTGDECVEDTKTQRKAMRQKLILKESLDERKPKLRTSKDIYDRLKWDSTLVHIQRGDGNEATLLDISSVYVGYKDRFLGMCELPLDDFQPGGEIPFHRVYYFRTGGPPILPFIGENGEVKVREDNIPEEAVFIWDRETRTDLIFMSGNSK